MNISVQRQDRQSLAFQLTPRGAVVLVPRHMDPEGEEVRRFIADAVARLPEPEPAGEPLAPEELREMVAGWSQRLGVHATRLQIRSMRTKWGSISTAGTLTLADDVLGLPEDLAEYIVVHELLHLKIPDHGKGWQVSMGMYLPDWRERERWLQAYVIRSD